MTRQACVVCFPPRAQPGDRCTCAGCWACAGHVPGCTCDIDWDCEHVDPVNRRQGAHPEGLDDL